MKTNRIFSTLLWLLVPFGAFLVGVVLSKDTSHHSKGSSEVVVESLSKAEGPPIKVTREHRYRSDVTLYIEEADGSRTPSGWSTRVEDGAATEQPFEFQPGINLIQGWTTGVLMMEEGERALLHVPSSLGYGSRPMGSKGGAFWIPPNSDLLFDIKILGKVGDKATEL